MYSLLATTLDKFRNAPLAFFHASGHCRGASDCAVHLAEVIVSEVQGNRSFKVFQFFAECVREARETATVHPQRVILLFNVRSGNTVNLRHSAHDRLFNRNNL